MSDEEIDYSIVVTLIDSEGHELRGEFFNIRIKPIKIIVERHFAKSEDSVIEIERSEFTPKVIDDE